MPTLYFELIAATNVPASAFGGRPNMFAAIHLDPTAANSSGPLPALPVLPSAIQLGPKLFRTEMAAHAPDVAAYNARIMLRGAGEREVVHVVFYDQIEVARGFIDSVRVVVGGPGKERGARTLLCEGPSGMQVRVAWCVCDGDATPPLGDWTPVRHGPPAPVVSAAEAPDAPDALEDAGPTPADGARVKHLEARVLELESALDAAAKLHAAAASPTSPMGLWGSLGHFKALSPKAVPVPGTTRGRPCPNLESILQAPTRPLTMAEESRLIEYEGPRAYELGCSQGALTSALAIRVPSLLPFHGNAIVAAQIIKPLAMPLPAVSAYPSSAPLSFANLHKGSRSARAALRADGKSVQGRGVGTYSPSAASERFVDNRKAWEQALGHRHDSAVIGIASSIGSTPTYV